MEEADYREIGSCVIGNGKLERWEMRNCPLDLPYFRQKLACVIEFLECYKGPLCPKRSCINDPWCSKVPLQRIEALQNYKWVVKISGKLRWEKERSHKNFRKGTVLRVAGHWRRIEWQSPPTSCFPEYRPCCHSPILRNRKRGPLPVAYLCKRLYSWLMP